MERCDAARKRRHHFPKKSTLECDRNIDALRCGENISAIQALAMLLSEFTTKDGRNFFEPVGEGVMWSFDKDGFAATAAGQYVGHW
jgi:hypothetical protein